MSAFDRLQNYSARHGLVQESEVFDVTTPQGAFLDRVHKEGYALFEKKHFLNDVELSVDGYNFLSEDEKSKCIEKTEYTELYEVLTTPGNQLINAIAGSGKALRNGTRVLTVNGYQAIETLKIGDLVFGDDGKVYPVKGVYPQGSKKEYEVCFSNGESIICCGDHLWTNGDNETKSTREWKESFDNSIFNLVSTPIVSPLYAEESTDKILANSIKDRWVYLRTKYRIDEVNGIIYCNINTPSEEIEKVKYILNTLGYSVSKRRLYDNICLSYTRGIEIISINALDSYSEMTCIEIDSPSHLYITENCIATHNTTSLVFKIMHDIITDEVMTIATVPSGQSVRVVNKVWVCTFLRTGAEELSKSLLGWQRKLGYSQTGTQVAISTLDAEFKRCLEAMGIKVPIGSNEAINSAFKKAVDSCNIKRDGNYALTKEDYSILSSIVTYYRGRLDEKRYQHPSCSDYDLTPTILDLLVNQFATLRKTAGIMDFDEVQELLYKYLYVTPNANVQEFVSSRYNFIYIDEFQDTSQMQYAILKFYARGKLWLNRSGDNVIVESEGGTVPDGLYTAEETLGKIVAMGDPSQTIYSFKGSDSKIIVEDFDKDFRPSISALSVNWRCPKNILEPIVPSIHLNRDSANQKILACRDGGSFYAYEFTSMQNMVKQLCRDIEEDIKLGNTIAVLCRTNFDGMIPALVLENMKKFDFGISGANMTLSSPLSKKLIGVSSLFTERSTTTVKNTLCMFVPRSHEYEVKQLVDTLKGNNLSIWQIPDADLKYSCPFLYDFIKQVKDIIFVNGKRDRTKELEALRFIYAYLIMNVFSYDSAYCQSARSYIETLLYIIDTNEFESVYAFLEEIDFLNDKLNGRIKRVSADIQIATVHEFKGKERDSIYVWNDSEGVFPSAKCDEGNEEELNEERRVHYIACTRAKKREHIYTLKGKVGRFVKEMDLTLENPIQIGVSL